MASKDLKKDKKSKSFIERHGGKKYTPLDVEASFSTASKKISDKKNKLNANTDRGFIFRIIVLVILGIIIAVCGFMWNADNSSASEIKSANEVKIIDLESNLDDILLKQKSIKTSNDVQRQIHIASEKGSRIAALQNSFTEVMLLPDGPDRIADIDNMKAELRPFFSESLISGSFNPLTPWYIKWDLNTSPETIADPSTYGWKFMSAYPSDDMSNLIIVWVDVEKDSDKILAWSRAVYDISSQEIVSIKVGRTMYGQKFVPGTSEATSNNDTNEVSNG